jgi:hypothetical protein
MVEHIFRCFNVAKACNLTPFPGHLKPVEGKSINHEGKLPKAGKIPGKT